MLIMKTSYNFLFVWNCMELYGEKIGQPGIIMTIDKKKLACNCAHPNNGILIWQQTFLIEGTYKKLVPKMRYLFFITEAASF